MFYIKTKLPSGKIVKTEITDENVYTRCSDCGRELPVDLAEVLSDGEGDLFSTGIICSACTKKRAETDKGNNGYKITFDGLALLSDTLREAGYCEQVGDIFNEFGVESVSDLPPEVYGPFADALKSLATEGGGL